VIVPIEETMSALIELKQQGKIGQLVFLIFRAQLEEITQYGRIDSLQPPYSLSGGRWNATLCLIASRTIFQSCLLSSSSGIVDWEI